FNVGVAQLQAGDAAGQSTIDAANGQINEICTSLGFTDPAECLAQFGLTLPEVPPLPEQPAPEAQPAEPAAGAAEPVTPEAVEVLPDVAPENAAPVLDSAKDAQPAPGDGATAGDQPAAPAADQPAEPPVEQEPAVPPPTSDADAQSSIAPVEVQSVAAEPAAEQIAATAL